MTFFFSPPLFLNICPKCTLLFFSWAGYTTAQWCTLPCKKGLGRALFVHSVSPWSSLFLMTHCSSSWWHGSSPPTHFLGLFRCLLSFHLSLQATLHSYTQFHSTWIYSALCSCHISCLLNAFTLLNIYLELKDIITQHLLQQVTGDDSFHISITAFWIILPSSIEQFRVQGCSETEQ